MPKEAKRAISYEEAEELRAALKQARKENASMVNLLRSINAHYLGVQTALLETVKSIGESRDEATNLIALFDAREQKEKEEREQGVQRDGTG